MHQIIKNYSLEDRELKLSIILGIFTTICCLIILENPGVLLDIEFLNGFENFREDFGRYLWDKGIYYRLEPDYSIFRVFCSIFAGILGYLILVPTTKQTTLNFQLIQTSTSIVYKIMTFFTYIAPLFILIMWLKPAVSFYMELTGASYTTFWWSRELLMILLLVTRFVLVRPQVQTNLNTALIWSELALSTNHEMRGPLIQRKLQMLMLGISIVAIELVGTIMLHGWFIWGNCWITHFLYWYTLLITYLMGLLLLLPR